MVHKKYYHLFDNHFPDNASHYCYGLWVEHSFNFKITVRRNTKLGDYRYNPGTQSHAVSVNGDLNPYAFLITYIHEVAHLVTYKTYGKKVLPHGIQWKSSFQQLFQPVLNDLVFPPEVLGPLKNYLRDPKASSSSDQLLTRALRNFDKSSKLLHLAEIQSGKNFKFNKRVFQKEEIKRTRVLCKEVKTGRKYFISKIALVEAMG